MIDADTVALLAKRILGGTRAADVIDWAGAQLVAGNDTPSLRMLAASGPPFYWSEIDNALGLALSELGVSIPPPESVLWQYARILAQQLAHGTVNAPQAVSTLYDIFVGLDYAASLAVWSDLDEAWQSVSAGYEAYVYPSVTVNNFVDIARREARDFLAQTAAP